MSHKLLPRRYLAPAIGWLVALHVAAVPAQGQSVLSGEVRESLTERPIILVDIQLRNQADSLIVRATSDEDGEFRMVIPDSGTFTLDIRRIGFAPITAQEFKIEEGEEVEIRILLDPRIIAIDPVTVIGRGRREPLYLTQFRERAEMNQRLGLGRIYMRDDLDRYRALAAQDLLRGLSLSPSCRPIILLDGMPSDDRLFGLTTDDLEGIEIYRGVTQIPAEYYRYGMCALTMVWTRADTPNGKPLTWGRAIVAGGILGLLLLLVN